MLLEFFAENVNDLVYLVSAHPARLGQLTYPLLFDVIRGLSVVVVNCSYAVCLIK